MGMTAHYRQITEFEYALFRRSPQKAYHACFGESTDVMDALQRFHAMAAPILSRTREIQARYRETGIYDRLEQVQYDPAKLSQSDKAIFEEQKAALEALHKPPAPAAANELNIDKAWQAIHYLLTGQAEGGDPPLADVIFGGIELPDRHNYTEGSPLRVLSSTEVRTIADELAAIPPDRLLARGTISDMAQQNIYSVSDDEPAEQDYIAHYYGLLRDFYLDAARKSYGLLLYIV